MAACDAAAEAMWLRSFLAELGFNQREPTIIFEDNQACIAMSKNPECHDRSKHIAIRYHFLREQVERGEIALQYVSTNLQLADLFTKGLPKPQFQRLRDRLGLAQLSDTKSRGSVGI